MREIPSREPGVKEFAGQKKERSVETIKGS